MIRITRINGSSIVVNALLIESVESTPDTLITLITGKKMMVREPVDEVVSLVKQYLVETKSQPAIVLNHSTEE
jgi:flagellar protein FlbD